MSVEYVGFFHAFKDQVKESWTQYWHSSDTSTADGGNGFVDDRETNFRVKVKERLERLKKQSIRRIDRTSSVDEDFSHLTRPKTRKELLQISSAVMGIEFSYAAETAFVSPLLLSIGLRHRHMTLMWCLSPLVGFFVTPLLGSLSDGCRSQLGRRRPFILLLSVGIILGLILVPNGKLIGRLLGDTYKEDAFLPPRTSDKSGMQFISPQTNSTGNNFGQNLVIQLQKNASTNNLTKEADPPDSQVERDNNENVQAPGSSLYSSAYKKQAFFSKYSPTMEDHGFRERNNLGGAEGNKVFLKKLNSKAKKFDLTELFLNIDHENLYSESSTTTTPPTNYKVVKSSLGKELGEISEEMKRNKKAGDATLVEDKSRNEDENSVKNHPWGLVFTILGTVLLDFDADACQSPSRAYMLDITIPEDHAKGLSTFTVMAGLGGCLGYLLGALNWENTFIGEFFGGQVRAVFTLVLFIFIGCVITTIRSFREIPLDRLWTTQPAGASIGFAPEPGNKHTGPYARFEEDGDTEKQNQPGKSYGTTKNINETSFNGDDHMPPVEPSSEEIPTFKEYVKTIVQLPKSLQWLCLTNFFSWMSLVCYSLYFTDFVGEAVFNGDPTAPLGSLSKTNYDDGVRFGCWGMSLYSLSCSLYSLCIESFVSRFGAKRVYITGQLVYSAGMVLMSITRNQFGVIFFSWTAGIMYATLFTMPYLLVARYHASETFDVDIDDLVTKPTQMRGLGTDVAIVSSMVFLAQMTQALILGSIVAAVGSTTAIVCAASVFAACGALSATKVLYLDL